MNANSNNSKLFFVNLPNSPAPVFAIYMPEKGDGDTTSGQDTSHEGRWSRLARILSTCAGAIALASTLAILVAR